MAAPLLTSIHQKSNKTKQKSIKLAGSRWMRHVPAFVCANFHLPKINLHCYCTNKPKLLAFFLCGSFAKTSAVKNVRAATQVSFYSCTNFSFIDHFKIMYVWEIFCLTFSLYIRKARNIYIYNNRLTQIGNSQHPPLLVCSRHGLCGTVHHQNILFENFQIKNDN